MSTKIPHSYNSFHLNKEGFLKENKSSQVKSLKVMIETETYKSPPDQDYLKYELIDKLSEGILKNNLCYFEKDFSPKDFNEIYYAEINVVAPGLKYVNLEQTVFKVGDEVFTNDELIEAVKSHFAERFI